MQTQATNEIKTTCIPIAFVAIENVVAIVVVTDRKQKPKLHREGMKGKKLVENWANVHFAKNKF